MTHVGSFPIEGRVTVLPHAAEQAIVRNFYPELAEFASSKIVRKISDEVLASIEAGRVYDTKPRPFRLYPYNEIGMPPWQRFVLSGDGQRGWVIALDSPPDVTVVTSLARQAKIPRR